MTHDQIVAATLGVVLLVLSTVSAVAGVFAAEVPLSVIASVCTSLFLLLLGFVAWIAKQVYEINGTTSATNELVHGAVSDVDRIEQRLDAHDIAIARLQGWPPPPPTP